ARARPDPACRSRTRARAPACRDDLPMSGPPKTPSPPVRAELAPPELAAQDLAQAKARVVHARLHRADGAVEDLGDLAIAGLVEIGQVHHGAMPRAEPPERRGQDRLHLAVAELGFRP